MTNLKVAARALRRNAGFSIGVTLIMAVAIGANTAMFSVYDRLRPAPGQHSRSVIAGRDLVQQPAAQRADAVLLDSPLRRTAGAHAIVLIAGPVGLRQLHADRKSRTLAAERASRQRDVLADAGNPAALRPQLHGAGGRAERAGRRDHQPRGVAVAARRAARRRPDDPAQWDALGSGRRHAAESQCALRPGAGVRPARLRGGRADRGADPERRHLRAADCAAEAG